MGKSVGIEWEKEENKDRKKVNDEEPSDPQRRNDTGTRNRKSSSLP